MHHIFCDSKGNLSQQQRKLRSHCSCQSIPKWWYDAHRCPLSRHRCRATLSSQRFNRTHVPYQDEQIIKLIAAMYSPSPYYSRILVLVELLGFAPKNKIEYVFCKKKSQKLKFDHRRRICLCFVSFRFAFSFIYLTIIYVTPASSATILLLLYSSPFATTCSDDQVYKTRFTSE